MGAYLLRRLLLMVPVWLGVSVVIFAVIRFIPGDAADIMMEQGRDAKAMAAIRANLGLDRPMYEQYAKWLWGAVQGDLGKSFWTGKPVTSEIIRRVPVSLELGLLALAIAIGISLPVGFISAARQDTWMDYCGRLIAISGLCIPGFWLGTMLILMPSYLFNWTPPLGYVPLFKDPSRNLQQLILPAITLGAAMAGSLMRMSRTTLLEVLRQDYVRTAWAKGLRERMVLLRHALKNAMIPVITILGVQFGFLIGGTVIIEMVFSLPGVGRLTVDSILQRDFPQLQGNVLVMSTVFLIINLLVDLSYAWLDPRIRYS